MLDRRECHICGHSCFHHEKEGKCTWGTSCYCTGFTVGLSPKEFEVVKLLAVGNNCKEIANKLDRSVNTIEAHMYNTYRKLRCHNQLELIIACIRAGIVKIDDLPNKIEAGIMLTKR